MRGKRAMITFIRRALIVSCCAIVIFMQTSCVRDSYWVELSGPVTIGDQWIELHPRSPLKVEKTLQWIQLELEPPFRDDFYAEGNGPNKGKGLIMPDGEIINPEIEVIDQYGNAFKLVWGGSKGVELPNYELQSPNKLPADREYKMVRLRSPRAIKCKAIYWFCESSKDWK
jgi:hypothetical protein